mmetsp:Transcript_10708/g.49210  ORF Transcript_10708/g.49210 Transcript_10708/m.49210 type:complete len:562 (+) Transcript_10708:7453-9138(+)
MARGFRPSLNPAPDGVHAGPERNDSIGTTHAKSARRHPHVSSGGGACDALATCPSDTYPSGGTGAQNETVPAFLPCARHPESRHTHSQSTGKAIGSIDLEFNDLDDAPFGRIRTTVVDAGGCSSDTATSPTDTNPVGHTGRHTESRECAPLLWSHHTRVNSTTVIVAGGGSVFPPAPLPILPEVRRSDGEADVAGCDSSKTAELVAGEVVALPPFESPFSGNSPGRPVGERRSQTGAVADSTTVLAQLSAIHAGASPSPAHARPRRPSAAHTSSDRTHRTQSAFGGGCVSSVWELTSVWELITVATRPRATNPRGGTGRHSARPFTAPFRIADCGIRTGSNPTGCAVNAGESRITSAGSPGGLSPNETRSPKGAYPAGGVVRHIAHDAAPAATPEMPSPNAPASFVVRGFDFDFDFEFPDSAPALEDQTGTKTLHGRAGCAAVAAASLCATLSTSASLVDDNAKRNGPLTTVMRASSRGSPAASAVEILRNVRSTGASTCPSARGPSAQRPRRGFQLGTLTPTRSSCTCTSVSVMPSSSSSLIRPSDPSRDLPDESPDVSP